MIEKKFIKSFIIIPFLIIHNLSLAQKPSDLIYVPIKIEAVSEKTIINEAKSTLWWGNSFDRAVFEFSNILRESNSTKKEQQRIENARQQSAAKLSLIKSEYSNYESYPSTIIDGWHNAIATDNLNFCKDVKVLVEDNRITKFVIDNYLPLNFRTTREIKDAKNIVTIKDYNGEQLNLVEVYFYYDLEKQNLVSEPLSPGCVCFWSDLKRFDAIQLRLDGELLEKFTSKFESEPNSFSEGMVCRVLKPGKYSFRALGKGTIDWEGDFEIKENMCLKYRLGK